MSPKSVWLFVVIIGVFFLGRMPRGLAEAPPVAAPDYTKPLFTQRQTPVCSSRDDLQTLLSVFRNGQKDLLSRIQGCMFLPFDGIPVVVLDREGFIDVWMRVRLLMPSGDQPIVWTVGWMLQNDGSQVITKDPAVGKVRICVTKGLADNVHVPALAMFTNEGSLVGDLQDNWSRDNYDAATRNEHAALITTSAADLSKDEPCAEVSANMFLRDAFTAKTWPASPGIVWDFNHVLGYTVGKLAQPGKLEWLRGQIALRALVSSDLGNPLSMSEEEAAKSQPENPLNRIPADLQLARTVPANGPDGKGNFKICLSKDIDEVPDKEAQSVKIVPNLIFESEGQLIGGLRSPEPDTHYFTYDRRTSWSVMTLRTFTLSKKHPCAITSVRSVLSDKWPWLFPLIRVADNLHFQALKLKGHSDTRGLLGHLGEAIDNGALIGTPVADIGDPLDLKSENPW